MSDEDRLIAHEYDGIHEYDNPLPFWWSAVFALTVVFAIVYGYWFHGGGPGRSIHAEFAADWKVHQHEVAEAAARTGLVVTEELLTDWGRDPDTLDAARKIFATNCVGCHTDNGRGLTGPNLTDDYQIHGTTRLDIHTTVHDGVVAKGMLAWGQILPAKDVAVVAAYVATLRGTNVPNGKSPEGARVGTWK